MYIYIYIYIYTHYLKYLVVFLSIGQQRKTVGLVQSLVLQQKERQVKGLQKKGHLVLQQKERRVKGLQKKGHESEGVLF